MPGRSLLDRQIAKATSPAGAVDLEALKLLVIEAYNEKELDRRRSDRASQLVAEELQETLERFELQNVRFKAAMDNMSQGLALFDRDGRLTVHNRRFLEIFSLPADTHLVGMELYRILDLQPHSGTWDDIDRRMIAVSHEFIDRRHGGTIEQAWPDGRIIAITRRPVADGGFLDTIADITEQRHAAAQIAHLARHDALTDLPNRVLLRERLSQIVTEADRGHTAAILCIDLDRFKLVNDTLGHPVGDALLIAVSRRLRSVVREGDLVVRLGGDEFAIVQTLLPSSADPEILTRRVVSVLSKPYDIDGHNIQVGASVGIARIETRNDNPDEILRNADLALYQAKADGRGNYRVFEPSMHLLANRKRQLELDLRAALQHHQIEVHYQPQINIKSGMIVGFEALARWRHPERGFVSPLEFISLSEEVGLIDRLGALVLDTACRDATQWPSDVKVAVNLSALQFRSGHLVSAVEDALKRNGLDPYRLELEITEGVMLTDNVGTLDQLRALKRLGVHISLDDFGTGYSSLSYIRSFPFDKIKIDQSFVRELGVNPDSLAIIRAVAGMCGSLGIATTAEGVETDGQLQILTDEKCDSVQGFLFGRAAPAKEALAMLQRAPFARAA